MINKELRELLLKEFGNNSIPKQLKEWKEIAKNLIGHKIFVLWVTPRSIQKSEVVKVDKVTNYFMTCYKEILSDTGERTYTIPVTIPYSSLVSSTVYIELLDEEV